MTVCREYVCTIKAVSALLKMVTWGHGANVNGYDIIIIIIASTTSGIILEFTFLEV